jgi:hypothetical protein
MEQQYEIGSSQDRTYVYARAFRQPYTLKLALSLARELNPLGERLGVRGCLLDIRGTTSLSSAVDKYEFAYKEATGVGVPRHWRIALLKDAGDDSPDFMETVMMNAGYVFQIFEDEREAIDWLKAQNPANSPLTDRSP